ncbi:ATP-binding protein [Pelagibacterium sp. 26DY04]|uniref:ATP-binding protein n=1 Tax=Pelagibacterium sp. 26DY04 TaxID=2967130 RepID=UPI0028166C03|nr:ATP-binding protein [Pelagibacterium sp. 26DY04]WMT87489.1 ATP-binding protein [Pelagibacterium sp. 26DY04]
MSYKKPSNGIVYAAFADMRIHHPRLAGAHAILNDAREAGRLTPYRPKRYVEFFAPSHSGKSMAIETYIEDVVVDEVIERGLFPADMDRAEIARKQNVVLHVTLSPKASTRSLAADILRQLGDPNHDKGDGPVLLRRVYEYLSGTYKDPVTQEVFGRQTELLVLDEIQHLSASKVERPDGKTEKSHKITSTEVTDTLKTMMIRGLVPMVLVGVPEAREHLAIDVQLTNREMAKIDFSPLRWSVEEDQAIFIEYCLEAAALIKEWELLPEDTDLLEDSIPHMLWAASGGCIGVVSRILEEAVYHALKRDAARVEFEDLALAVDTRAIPNNNCTYNPFRLGVRNSKVT